MSEQHRPVESEEQEDDPMLDRIVLIFLAVFLAVVVLTPSEWLLKLSLWWNGLL